MSELQQGRGACHIKGRRRNICNQQPMSEGICDQLDDIAGGSNRKAKTKNLENMVTDRIEGRKSLHWTEWIADISASSPSFYLGGVRMDVKKYLEDAVRLRRRIERKEQDLYMLRISSDGMTGKGNANMQKTVSPDPHKTEVMVCRIMALENEIHDMRTELNTLISQMRTGIKNVDDDDIRDVLTKRYLEFKTWRTISNEMNYSESTCYRLHRSGLMILKRLTVCDSTR